MNLIKQDSVKIKDIVSTLEATVLCGQQRLEEEAEMAFSSDLMSDVLTLKTNNVLLITGLCNIQAIRTAEMSDINKIIFARGKKATPEMIELAEENNIMLIECSFSLFKAAGLLYNAGIKPIY